MADPISERIQPGAKLRTLLASSKKEPVHAAIGLTGDGEGLILLDKRAKPKTVLSLLKAEAKSQEIKLNTATLRFGRAEVNPEYDPSMVRFFVNKEPPGSLRAKLVIVVKRASFSKVEINVDPTLEDEPEGDGTAAAAAATAEAAVSPSEPPPPPPPGGPAGPNADALGRELAALIRRVGAVPEGAQRDGLLRLAETANAARKAGQLERLASSLVQIREQLPSVTQPEGNAADGAVVRVAKGLLLWNNTRSYVTQQVKRLQDEILKQTAGLPEFPTIQGNIGNLEVILERLDDRLSAKLDALRGTTDPSEKTKLAEEARAIVTEYQAFVAQDRLMGDIDENGFVPLDINVKVSAVLSSMLKVI